MSQRAMLPLPEWPSQDQALWHAGLMEADDLEKPLYAAQLSPMTIRNACRGYGRFLAVLAGAGLLAGSSHPVERITPPNVRLFVRVLRESGNCNNTVAQRIWELRTALRIMCPERDFRWLTSPNEASIRALLPARQRMIEIIDFRELFQWGLDLAATGMVPPLTTRRAHKVRNGLIIGILACRAPRQRTLAAPRIGKQFIRGEDVCRFAFTSEDTKTHRRIEYPLPPQLTPVFDFYLDHARPLLLRGQTHDWLWVGQGGDRLEQIGIYGMVRHAWRERYGKARGTHIFRHCLATTVSLADMQHPAAAAAIIGASPDVVQRCYDRAQAAEAAYLIDTDFLQERQQYLTRQGG